MVLGPYDPALIGAVTLFDNEYCWGDSARFYWDPPKSIQEVMEAVYNYNSIIFMYRAVDYSRKALI